MAQPSEKDVSRMSPSERLAQAEAAAATEASLEKTKVHQYSKAIDLWFVIFFAGLLCFGVGLWNYQVAGEMQAALGGSVQAVQQDLPHILQDLGASIRQVFRTDKDANPSARKLIQGPVEVARYLALARILIFIGGSISLISVLMMLTRKT